MNACAAHYSVNTLQLHKIIEEANRFNIRKASFCIFMNPVELS